MGSRVASFSAGAGAVIPVLALLAKTDDDAGAADEENDNDMRVGVAHASRRPASLYCCLRLRLL